jgi:toxin ParE1/3/4
MAKLNWTSESERWLKDIHDYIAADNPQAAGRVLEGIYEKAQILIRFPDVGYSYDGSDEDIRILLYGHYRITYLKRLDGDIDILGVFHGALDIDRYLL